jgi:hypothetical protein
VNKRQLLSFIFSLAIVTPALAHPGGVNAPSPDFPPIVPEGYINAEDVFATYSGPALEVVLSMVEIQPFAAIPPSYLPDGERHHFESILTGQISINGGPALPLVMNGPTDTIAYGRGPGPGQLGTFDTEMLAMSLTGGPAVLIRESPTKASTGKLTVTDIGGGLYHIDSFFDVFTELSLDGGQTWIPQAGTEGTRINLGGVPEPASVILLLVGLLGIAGLSRGRR